jgi:DNA ligase-1
MTIIRDTIYKRTSSGKVQIWFVELDQENGQFRTISGQQDGKKTTSNWTVCEPKNVGRSNATTASEQALLEVDAMYEKKLAREYHRDISDIDNGTRYVEPMLADKWKDRKEKISSGALLFIQPKLDGYRAIAQYSAITKHNVSFTSRDGKLFPGAELISEHLSSLFARNTDLLLDGELYNHDLKSEFERLGSVIKKELKTPELRERARVLQFHVYDIPSEQHSNYASRKAALDELFSNEVELQNDLVQNVRTESIIWNDEGRVRFEEIVSEFLEDGYEGAIVRMNTPYEHKRSKGLLKVKDFMDAEFEIADIEEGKGNWEGCAKRVFIVVPTAPVSHGDRIINRDTGKVEKFDGTQTNFQRVSKATPKGTQDEMRLVLQNRANYIGKFATLQYFRFTNDGVPYLPIIKALVRLDDARNI